MILKGNKELKQKDFVNEKELQTYFEKNIENILGYKFVETEFAVGNFRIDTLAFDEESKSFKIIEFKNVKNHSLIDQGYTYLKLMLERKADFVLKYNENIGKQIMLNEVDWSQSRVFFVSTIFTEYQLNATDFKNLPFDLIKATKYEDDIYEFDFIQKNSKTKVEEVFNTIENNEVNNEIKVYTEEDHLAGKDEKIIKLYEELKERVLQLDDIDVEVKKVYIAFKGIKNIFDVEVYKKFLQITLNMKNGTIDDPNNIMISFITKDNKKLGHHGNGDYYFEIHNEEDIDKVMPFIRQSLKVNKK